MGDTLSYRRSLQPKCERALRCELVCSKEGRTHSSGRWVGEESSQRQLRSWLAKTVLGGGERGEGKHSSLPAQHVCSHGGVKGHRVFQNGQDWVWSEGRTWGWSGRGGSRASTVSDVPLPARPPASGSGRGSAMLVTRCRWGWGWPGVRRAD